jgi:3-dehydroquinate synthase
MPSFLVRTAARDYSCIVERGALRSLAAHLPPKRGKLFVVTTVDVWDLFSTRFTEALSPVPFEVLFFPGGEERKRISEVESLADQMVQLGADRSSLVIAFGGGIVGDLAGFLAATFMRGVHVIQVPTTLLAQVDASIGGKTGANLVSGKNLIGAFHQPLAVLIDPDLVRTLPPREFRAGLYEVIKAGIIASPDLFEILLTDASRVLDMQPDLVEKIIAESVRIKAEVVSNDERESDLRRILNFGHTIGHALEAETSYARLLHGEAVAFGMRAASYLGHFLGVTTDQAHAQILSCIDAYGTIPGLEDIRAENLLNRLISDKKTIQGKVHFVLISSIGRTVIRSGIDPVLIRQAIDSALSDLVSVQ